MASKFRIGQKVRIDVDALKPNWTTDHVLYDIKTRGKNEYVIKFVIEQPAVTFGYKYYYLLEDDNSYTTWFEDLLIPCSSGNRYKIRGGI